MTSARLEQSTENLRLDLGKDNMGWSLESRDLGFSHLLKVWTARFEDDVILKKWVFDILRAARDAFEDSGLPVSSGTYDIQTKVLPSWYISQLPLLCDNFYTSDGDIQYSASDAESDTDLDSSDSFEWLDQPEANIDGVERCKFDVGNLNIDVGSSFFLDFLSDQRQAMTTANSAAPANPKPVNTPSSLVPDESEWGKW